MAAATQLNIRYANVSLGRNLVLLKQWRVVAAAAAAQLNIRYANVSLRRNLVFLKQNQVVSVD